MTGNPLIPARESTDMERMRNVIETMVGKDLELRRAIRTMEIRLHDIQIRLDTVGERKERHER